MNEIPKSWISCELGDVVDYGKTLKTEPQDILEDAWILELEDVEKDTSAILNRLTFRERKSKSTKNKFRKGDVLYGKLRPYLNKVVQADADGYSTTEIIPLSPSAELDGRYLFYWLKHPSFLAYVTSVSHGLNMPRLGTEAGQRAPFVLAPANEQKRIAGKLDALLSRVDSCRERLDRIPAILKRFRQSVLAAATSGKLTEDWRKENGIEMDWNEVKLGEICDIQGGVTVDRKKQSSEDSQFPYLRVANVQRLYLDLAEVKTIRIPKAKVDQYMLKRGDVLFTEGGDIDKLGRGWVWEEQIENCSFQNHIFRARLNDSTNQPKFISWWGNYQGILYFLRAGKQTTNLASINKSTLAALPVSLPSSVEQAEIVRRVETLFAQLAAVDTEYALASEKVNSLAPSLLAKAFRGELVPQDPSDEPASVLLERIRQQRETEPSKSETKKSSKPTRKPRAPKTKAAMTKSRFDDDVQGKPYLATFIKVSEKKITAEDLFKKADLPLVDFYKQLDFEVKQKMIVDRDGHLEAA